MKTGLKYLSALFVVLMTANIACTDYLTEVNRTGSTEDIIYSTKSGLDGLLGASYSYLRGWYGKEAAYGLSECGTDLWLTGYDNRQKVLVDYSGITPEVATSTKETMNACFDEYWELFYTAINTVNTGLKNVPLVPDNTLSNADKNVYIGELKALRALYYWHLVETWGPVQINREPVNSVSTEARRDSEQDVYNFMLEDIDDAIARLAGKTTKTGHINLWAAKAIKARLLLYKASKFNDNQAYLDAAATADEVISGSGLSFYTNYADCWSGVNENGINNREVIWWVDYSEVLENNILSPRLKLDASGNQMTWSQMILRNGSNTIGGNAAHLMFVGVWNMVPGLTAILIRTDTEAKKVLSYQGKTFNLGTAYQPYSKGFTRYVPSGYLLDLFNDATDQRYQASFRDVYYVAPELQAAFTAGTVTPPSGYANMRDTAIYLSKKPVTAGQISRAANRYVLFTRTDVGNPAAKPLYQDAAATLPTIATGTSGNENFKGNRMYIQLKKFDDYTGSIIRDLCSRDAFVFRLSEMYLIAAEGYMMAGQTANAIARLNTLRTARAKAGQSNVLSPAEETAVGSKDVNVILDERARELCGEQQRWFDLKRTGKLLDRVKQYNGSAKNNIKDFHTLRPIPQPQMDAVTNKTNGPDPKGFWQNPGY
ncbi:MAG: RagB/SusD family nutrient uptake outer membrane protein [Bacteroidales bacterium]|nr:RagB/SusD family nutrient uptake outer membrane protein [Bacteroidales bacterium]